MHLLTGSLKFESGMESAMGYEPNIMNILLSIAIIIFYTMFKHCTSIPSC